MSEINYSAVGAYGEVRDGRLFGPQGGIGNHEALQGFAAARRNADVAHKRRVTEAARLYSDCLNGREDAQLIKQAIAPTHEVWVNYLHEKYPGIYGDPGGRRMLGLRETMSVTDYQALYVDVLDRMYYGYYNAFPIVNKSLVRVHQLRDFRLVSRYLLDGAVSPLTAMDAAAPPPQRALLGPAPQDGSVPPDASTSTAPIQYQPLLYQAMTSVNWRAFINDDLGIFKDLSNRLAIAGNRGISKFITTQYVASTGLKTSLYQSGYRNLVTPTYGATGTNPPMSVNGVSDALTVLYNMRDSTGDPILVTGRLKLWYGPSLMVTANNLMNQLSVYISNNGGGEGTNQPGQLLNVNNWLIQNMDLVMDPYIPIVASSAAGNIKNTIWGITVDPNTQSRPNTEVGFLTGFETPQIFSKVPNTQRMGGGVDAMMGDFYTMDSDMKIVTVMGGATIDGRSTVCSTGAGS